MVTLRLILLVFALVCFILAGLGVQPPRGGNLIGIGLAFWIGSELIGGTVH